jgi:hypothetical protein
MPPLDRSLEAAMCCALAGHHADAAGATASLDNSGEPRTRLRSFGARVRLVEVGDREAIDVFLRRKDALAALEGCVQDEPDWEGLFYVVPIELDERDVSAN